MSSPIIRRVSTLSEQATRAVAKVEVAGVREELAARVAEVAREAVTEVVRPGEGAAGAGLGSTEPEITKVQGMMKEFIKTVCQKENSDTIANAIIASFKILPSEQRMRLLIETWNSWPDEADLPKGKEAAHGQLFDLIIKKAIPTKDFIEHLDLIKEEDDLIRGCLIPYHFFKEETKWVPFCQSIEIGTGFMVGSKTQKQFVREKIQFIRELLRFNKHKLLLEACKEDPKIGLVRGMFDQKQIILQVLLEIDTKQRRKRKDFDGLDKETIRTLCGAFNMGKTYCEVSFKDFSDWVGGPRNATPNYGNISQLLIDLRQIGARSVFLKTLCMHFITQQALTEYNRRIDCHMISNQKKGFVGFINYIIKKVDVCVQKLKQPNKKLLEGSQYPLGSSKLRSIKAFSHLRKQSFETIDDYMRINEQVERLEKQLGNKGVEGPGAGEGAGAGVVRAGTGGGAE